MKVLVVLLLFFSMPVSACLQTSQTDIDGNTVTISVDPFDQLTARRRGVEVWAERVKELAGKVEAEPGNRKVRNDYGVA